MRFWLAVVLLASPLFAQARVFNYKDSEVAGYIRGTGGFSMLNQDAFANSSGGTSISGASKYNYGGEIGFMFGLGTNFHMRIGAEVIQENPVNANGTNAAGTSMFSLSSTVLVFNPNLAFEYVYSNHGNTRFYGVLGVGYATVTASNNYTMTAAGTTALGVSSFKETFGANAISGQAGVGLETLFTDNATFMADIGYRYLPVTNLKYQSAASTIASPGGVTSGQPVLNQDGSNRTMNLSGIFGGVAFRFYLNFL